MRHASAPAAAIFAALVQYVLLPEPAIAPFVFFYFSVALVAWVFGRGPGLMTVLLSAVIANWAFVSPYRQFNLSGPALTATLLFIVSAGAVATLCALFRDALLRARRAAAQFHRQAALLRESEKALRIANERLTEADHRKDEFLGMLSHELRNPLAPIRNSIYIAGRAVPGSEQERRALSVIERQVFQLTRLVDDLLDVTRIARGKIRLQREKVELQSLATQTVEDYLDLFEKNGLRLEVMHTDEPLFVNADRARLAQIIGNLLQNAAKFTPRGSRTTVSIRRADEDHAEVSVQDDGPGIDPEVMEILFEPFAQGERTLERSSGGLGLGLALVKGLVELHGGNVSAHSAGQGHGATFVVRIPVERRKTPRLALLSRPTGPSTPRRVLVIEDNIDAAETLKEALELNGHAVALAYTGSEGIEQVRAFKPDVVICDIGLPGMNGLEVARDIRADPDLRTTTLIALSGYALPDDVDRATAAGFDSHLAKPPDLLALEQLIAEARATKGGTTKASS